jgi:hypothetical protein
LICQCRDLSENQKRGEKKKPSKDLMIKEEVDFDGFE